MKQKGGTFPPVVGRAVVGGGHVVVPPAGRELRRPRQLIGRLAANGTRPGLAAPPASTILASCRSSEATWWAMAAAPRATSGT